jgi:hypothetical protein
MVTTAPANPHELLARSRKAFRLTMAFDNALDMMGVDPFSAAALEFVLAANEKAWAEAVKHARCQPPSETTKEEVRSLYRTRVEARKALAFLRKPVLTVVR